MKDKTIIIVLKGGLQIKEKIELEYYTVSRVDKQPKMWYNRKKKEGKKW